MNVDGNQNYITTPRTVNRLYSTSLALAVAAGVQVITSDTVLSAVNDCELVGN